MSNISNTSNLNISDLNSNLVRDYQSIVKWFVTKLQYLTTKWTDITTSEPDTLTLAYIAHLFDIINYKLDYKYINSTLFNTDSLEVMSDIYKLIGEELHDYDSLIINANVSNNENINITVKKWDIVRLHNYSNELFTVIDNYVINAKAKGRISFIRGIPNYSEVKKSEILNGEYIIYGNDINRTLIEVLINNEPIQQLDENIIFSDEIGFQVIQHKDRRTKIKLSPKALQEVNDYIIIRYLYRNDTTLANNSRMELLNYNYNVEIRSISNDYVSNFTINNIKEKYLNFLNTVNTIANTRADLNKFKDDYLDYIKLGYETKKILLRGTVEYNTGNLVLFLNYIPLNPEVTVTWLLYNPDSGISIPQATTIMLTSLENYCYLYGDNPNTIPEGWVIQNYTLLINDIDYNNVIVDLDNDLRNISFDYVNKINYSTSNNTPLDGLLDTGELINIDPFTYRLDLILNYQLNKDYYLTYDIENSGIVNTITELITTNDLVLNRIINIPAGFVLLSETVRLTIGNYVLGIDPLNQVTEIQTNKDFIANYMSQFILQDRTIDDLVFNKLNIKYVNVVARVHLFQLDTNINNVRTNIETALRNRYNKFNFNPYDIIYRVAMIVVMEQSDPNINFVEMINPDEDLSLGINELIEIGTIQLEFVRS